jgi:hypothetical protein
MSSASSWSAPVICPARPWLAAGPAPTAPVPGSGSHRATNLIAGYGLTSALDRPAYPFSWPVRPSLGLSGPRHGPDQFPGIPMVTGRPAAVLCLAGGCAAGLPARGAIG